MKVTFVYPDISTEYIDWPGSFYVGIASLCSVLKQKGHQVSLIHVIRPVNKDDFIKKIKAEDPDLIGFSSTSHHFSFVRDYASWLVEAKIKVPTIYGGVHPTITPEESIALDGIDMICRGEGETSLTDLCFRIENKEDISNIPNLWIKTNGTITRNNLKPLLKNLDELPFPDRSIFNYESLFDEREGYATMLVSRGCPFNCTYCCNQALRSIYEEKGKSVRFRSVDSVIDEIKQVLNDYPFVKVINFHDDILFFRKKWAQEFAKKYRRQINLPFICNARADVTNQSIVDLLKEAGCCLVKFGIESGNETIRFDILNRHMTNEQIKNAYALCKKAGLKTFSFNMVGMPYETPRTILDTIKLNASLGVDYVQSTIYQPYPATKLEELCRDNNFMESEDLGLSFFSQTVLQLKTVSSSQVLMFKQYFRILKCYYQALQNLPPKISNVLIALSDRILSSNMTSKVLNLLYVPLNHLYKFCQKLRLRRRRAKISSRLGKTE